ncbi:V-type ATP synthase subunit E family protein [Actinacidiphila sp. bgisy160]|uniref:V-type ATP synthase subunit E family protein n=1 Tax=Actinacidiphila sp. bgisy160 TaxID=3413796 RepID=UPI003D73BE75
MTDSLQPVRDSLLRRAQAEADELLARADSDAEATLAEADDLARAIMAKGRRDAEAEAARARAAAITAAHRQQRANRLDVQARAYRELRRQVAERVLTLREGPDYPRLLDALTRRARALLGPDADVREHPTGGVVARVPGRRADLTLQSAALRVVDGAGCLLESLWTP